MQFFLEKNLEENQDLESRRECRRRLKKRRSCHAVFFFWSVLFVVCSFNRNFADEKTINHETKEQTTGHHHSLADPQRNALGAGTPPDGRLLPTGRRPQRRRTEDSTRPGGAATRDAQLQRLVGRLQEHRPPCRRQDMGHVLRHHQLHPGRGPEHRLGAQGRRQLQPRALHAQQLVQPRLSHVHRPPSRLSHRQLAEQQARQRALRRDRCSHLHLGRGLLEDGTGQGRAWLRRHRVRTCRRIQGRLRARLLLHGHLLRELR